MQECQYQLFGGENGILTNAGNAKTANELSGYKEDLEIYKREKLLENNDFIEDSLTAGKTTLSYNTQKEGETGTIYTILPNLKGSKFEEKLEIIKGELLLTSQDKNELKVAQSVHIAINPYEIIDGELLSSDTNLLLIDSEGTLTLPETVTKIGSGAFSTVEGLKKIIIPSSVKEIADYAFTNNKELEVVVMSEGIEKIGINAFDGASNLREINLPDSINYIGSRAFRNCTSLTEITIPKNLKAINYEVFHNCTNLSKINLQEGIESIVANVFYNTKLSEISLPSTLKTIDSTAFSKCNIESFDLKDNQNFIYESSMLLTKNKNSIIYISPTYLNSTTTFNIPEEITSFSNDIKEYTKIKKLILPSTLTSIDVYRLPTSIEEIEVSKDNKTLISENGMLYNNENVLIACYSKENVINVPEGIKSLRKDSFRLAKNVEIVNLPDSLNKIEEWAFRDCSNLQTINIGKNVSSISATFLAINYKPKVTIDKDNNYYQIENDILYSKDKKTLIRVLYEINGDMTIDSGIETIGTSAFYGQRKMTKIIIPEGVKEIKANAFHYCSTLQKVEIPSTVEKIESCFGDATNNLEEIIIHQKENSITGAPWGAVKGLRAVKWEG